MTSTNTRRIVPVSHEANAYSTGAGGQRPLYEDDGQEELVLPAENMALAPEHLAERVQTTQHRLTMLRAEAEALEREKQQFEELSRKQREFMQGRAEMAERLSRSIAMLDRETYEAQKRVEQLLVIKDSFHQHLDIVDSLNPEQWDPKELQHDLTRALGMIEDAREEYAKGVARVQMLTHTTVAALPATPAATVPGMVRESASHQAPGLPVEISRKAFRTWVFCGAAFTLPLVLLGVLFMLVRLVTR